MWLTALGVRDISRLMGSGGFRPAGNRSVAEREDDGDGGGAEDAVHHGEDRGLFIGVADEHGEGGILAGGGGGAMAVQPFSPPATERAGPRVQSVARARSAPPARDPAMMPAGMTRIFTW